MTNAEPKTWEEAALDALDYCDPRWDYGTEEYDILTDLESRFNNHPDDFGWFALPAVRGYTAAIGSATLTDGIRNDIVALLARKQHDYGHDNILKHGEEGVRVRIWDKIARLKNLQARGAAAANESVVDSWLDVIGYCVIGVMLGNGTFTLPLEADSKPAGRVLRGTSPNPNAKVHSFQWNVDENDTAVGEALWTILNESGDALSVTVDHGFGSWKYEVAS